MRSTHTENQNVLELAPSIGKFSQYSSFNINQTLLMDMDQNMDIGIDVFFMDKLNVMAIIAVVKSINTEGYIGIHKVQNKPHDVNVELLW